MKPSFLPPDPVSDASRRLEEAQRALHRMEHSLSWRLTKPFRIAGLLIRRLRTGKPPETPSQITGPVAVVIPCHNYGRHLARAIDSLFTQEMMPAEIVVVDDSSTDDTAEVAGRYADKGVRYIRGEWKDVAQARNTGAAHTSQPAIMFLDADDWLPPHYIARCMDILNSNPLVGIAYGNMQYFEESDYLFRSPEFDATALQMGNYISSHALMRRSAFDLAGGYRTSHDGVHHDWDIYYRIVRAGWSGKKADTFVQYRLHAGSMLQQYRRNPVQEYWREAYLLRDPLTVFVIFTGRHDLLEPYMRALKTCDFNHALLRLHCLDISGDEGFGNALRAETASLPFGSVTHTRLSTDGRDGDTLAIFMNSHMRTACTTEYALLLGEDVLPGPHLLSRMLQTFTYKTAAVVAPLQGGETHAIWKLNEAGAISPVPSGTGTEEVGGGTLGCALLHMSILREIPLMAGTPDHPDATFEQTVFLRMKGRGNVLCNWEAGIRS